MVHDSEGRVHYHFIHRRFISNLEPQIITALLDVILYPSSTLTLLVWSHCLAEVCLSQLEVLY